MADQEEPMAGPGTAEATLAPAIAETAVGALYRSDGICTFRVWAPHLQQMSLKLLNGGDASPVPLERQAEGYWGTTVTGIEPGARYVFRLNGEKERPDPASRSQPDGVHGASQIVDPLAFSWEDEEWRGIPLRDLIIYELHTGTFTQEGTFAAAIDRLDHLVQLGVTAIEVMPVAQFPGTRNWGYDGVYPFAPQNSYGGTEGLKALVNACHQKGLAVILDVVYNHLGPDGNYLSDFGPYFTNRYCTPWGDAVNLDGPYSDPVRAFFIENALYWVTEFHMDGLRLDAIDTIYDFGPRHFLAELAETVHRRARELDRHVAVIAESDLNDVKVINSLEAGGFGLDAQWSDDFHHALHALVTGERKGYYEDFGGLRPLQKAFQERFVYSGTYSRYRKRRHGTPAGHVPARKFVVCSQNHDQIGNRRLGERLSALITFEQQKLVAGCVLLSPFIPLLFMGEEYGETAPFQYFVSHIDATLIDAIRKGRASEFANFEWQGHVPDPQDEKTFVRSRLHPELRTRGPHRVLFDYYRELIRSRRQMRQMNSIDNGSLQVDLAERERVLLIRSGDGEFLMAFSFNSAPSDVAVPAGSGPWNRLLDSSAVLWGGTGERSEQFLGTGDVPILRMNPQSVVLYTRRREERYD